MEELPWALGKMAIESRDSRSLPSYAKVMRRAWGPNETLQAGGHSLSPATLGKLASHPLCQVNEEEMSQSQNWEPSGCVHERGGKLRWALVFP